MLKIFFVVMFFFLCEGKPGLATCPEDKRSSCGRWKNLGYCDPKKGAWKFMAANCPASCGNCQSLSGSGNVNIKECLQAHNSKRALHGAAPLTWDTSLARKAQEWANYLASKNMVEHSPGESRFAGENLAFRMRLGKPVTCKDAVESWYREVYDYPFQNPPYTAFDTKATIGHFTQVVWKSTKKLGVGIASVNWRGRWIKTYIVARYSPSGNYPGMFKQEVGKRGKSIIA